MSLHTTTVDSGLLLDPKIDPSTLAFSLASYIGHFGDTSWPSLQPLCFSLMYWLIVNYRLRANKRLTLDQLCASAATPGALEEFYRDQQDLVYRQYTFSFTLPNSVHSVLPRDISRIPVTYEDINTEVILSGRRRLLSFDLLTIQQQAKGARVKEAAGNYEPTYFDYEWQEQGDVRRCTCGDKHARVLEWALAEANAKGLYERATETVPSSDATKAHTGMTIWLHRMWRKASIDDCSRILSAIQGFRDIARFTRCCDSVDPALTWPYVRSITDETYESSLDVLQATERYMKLKQQEDTDRVKTDPTPDPPA